MSANDKFSERVARIEAKTAADGDTATGPSSSVEASGSLLARHSLRFAWTVTSCMTVAGLTAIALYSLPLLEPLLDGGTDLDTAVIEHLMMDLRPAADSE